ncbi:hypothetical protein [Flavobacterium sp.]|uniref:hypothetical protein n=1 Tax=Flavobacterium sp. TaxID=239 RepID=UPI00121D91A3|nr:hypothetical protein [Flavobacterium sp.]RZJ71074.1 MAG: hypothetical protein EOO49_11515 [Flavobacterium sp.]
MRASTVLIILLSLMLLASLGTCRFYKNQGSDNLLAVVDTVKYFRNSIGVLTASKKTVEADRDQLKELANSQGKQMAAMTKEFRQVKSATIVSAPIFIPKAEVKFDTPLPCPEFERKGVKEDDKWFRFQYVVNQNGFSLDSLKVSDTLRIVNGTKRKWFLGKAIPTTDLTSSNPYSTPTIIFTASESKKSDLLREAVLFIAGTVLGRASKSL